MCCGNGNAVAFVTNIALSFANYIAGFGLFSILIDLWIFVVLFVVITVPWSNKGGEEEEEEADDQDDREVEDNSMM